MIPIFILAALCLIAVWLAIGALLVALCIALKLLVWALQFLQWLLNRFAEPQPGSIVINIVDEEDPAIIELPRESFRRLD